jgi:hypothetical protein
MEALSNQRAVEDIEIRSGQLGDFDPSKCWNDALVDGRPVADQRRCRSPLCLQVEHPLLEEVRNRAPDGGLKATVDFGGQIVGRLLGDSLASRDGPVDIPMPTDSRIATRGDPHLPSVRPYLADASGHGQTQVRFFARIFGRSPDSRKCL